MHNYYSQVLTIFVLFPVALQPAEEEKDHETHRYGLWYQVQDCKIVLQGASVAVFTVGIVMSLPLSYSTWLLYSNVGIVTTLTATSVGRLH